MRKFLIILMSLSLCWTTFACGSSSQTFENRNTNTNTPSAAPTQIIDGKYPVQQATYDDGSGEYTLFLLNTQPGTPANLRTTNLQLARLTDEQVKAGEKTFLEVKGGQEAMYLSEDFKIEYVHNVTETQTNPQTGQQETVVVRRESNFWTPFAGAFAGQIAANLLFTPRYYVPPVYQPGFALSGYGGYGNTYGQAVQRYQTRYNEPPVAVKNRQTLRTSGRLRSPSLSRPTTRRVPSNSTRSTGSGYGGSTLKRSNKQSPTYRSPSFGSGRSSRPASGFGSRRSGGRRR